MDAKEFTWPQFQPPTLDLFDHEYARVWATRPFSDNYKLAVVTTSVIQINEICGQDNLTAEQKLEAVARLAAQTIKLIIEKP